MKVLLNLCLLVAYVSSAFDLETHRKIMRLIETQPAKEQFKLWHYLMEKPYDINSSIGLSRYQVFKKNLKLISLVNNKQTNFKLGLTPFTDLTSQEFETLYLTVSATEEKSKVDSIWAKDSNNLVLNSTKDWSNLWNYPPLNQGTCLSCWAISTAATIEAYNLMKGINVRLSPQQVIDCFNSEKNRKCTGGGHIRYSFPYAQQMGLAKEESYPYTGKDGICDENVVPYIKIKSFSFCDRKLKPCSDEEPYSYLNNSGPYASALKADQMFAHYIEGIFFSQTQICDTPNHAAVVVSINTSEGFIKIRNSWGPLWGEGGYGKVLIQANGMRGCGLLEYAYLPNQIKILT